MPDRSSLLISNFHPTMQVLPTKGDIAGERPCSSQITCTAAFHVASERPDDNDYRWERQVHWRGEASRSNDRPVDRGGERLLNNQAAGGLSANRNSVQDYSPEVGISTGIYQ